MSTVIIYCGGPDDNPHPRSYVARYDRPFFQGDEQIDKWGPARSWRDGDSIVSVPEFERWVTDDSDESKAMARLSWPQRRLFRYRCQQCAFDEQRNTDSDSVDVWATRDQALDTLAARRIDEVPVRAFVAIWSRIMDGETPR
jgi:hypothetical protein